MLFVAYIYIFNIKIMENNFWRVKSMQDFTHEEWEKICLKCGKCCAEKVFNGRSVLFYNRVCNNLDLRTGLCRQYECRLCYECLKVDWEMLCKHPEMLPETCAYRTLKEKGCLPEYHQLITGDADSVKKAKQSVLDWKGLHTNEEIQLVVASVFDKANKENWSSGQFEDAISEALASYHLMVVETYKRNGS